MNDLLTLSPDAQPLFGSTRHFGSVSEPRPPNGCSPKIMSKLKLTVNEEKTRICKVPEGKFDFLGYTFGRMYSARTGQARLGYRKRARAKDAQNCFLSCLLPTEAASAIGCYIDEIEMEILHAG